MARSTPTRRSDCPISFSLELFGDRWTLLIVRDLALNGKDSFSQLLSSEEGIATNILSDRLKRLEQAGLVAKERSARDGRQRLYRLTEAGRGLLPILLELMVWGAAHDPHAEAAGAFLEAARRDRAGLLATLRERLP